MNRNLKVENFINKFDKDEVRKYNNDETEYIFVEATGKKYEDDLDNNFNKDSNDKLEELKKKNKIQIEEEDKNKNEKKTT